MFLLESMDFKVILREILTGSYLTQRLLTFDNCNLMLNEGGPQIMEHLFGVLHYYTDIIESLLLNKNVSIVVLNNVE
jgi:hypothetical protein